MIRRFHVQLCDSIDIDVCFQCGCQGPAPQPALSPVTAVPPMCLACARRRQGLSQRRTSGWWRCEPGGWTDIADMVLAKTGLIR